MKYSAPRGTHDILPETAPVWQALERTCRKLFELYHYKEIRTPVFEMTELFTRTIGESTDIVSKEMYTFADRKGRSLTLRPEGTAPVVRAALEGGLIGKDKFTKLYYFGPMFRYERPQAGRQRQFHQAGVEVFGSADPLVDVEVIALAEQIFSRLGLPDLEVNINSVGCKKCQPDYNKKLKTYFKAHLADMCANCQDRYEKNILRILDCKEAACQKFIEKAPAPVDSLCKECKAHFDQVLKYLDEQKLVKYRINDRLVRGLDYYTGTTFEVVSKQLGAQNAVCGGGRYDNLVAELGGPELPAVGFAIGLERLVEIIKSSVMIPRSKLGISLYIVTLGEAARKFGFDLLQKARKAGISSDMDYSGKDLKAQLKSADRAGANFALIVGENELKSGKALLKHMQDTSQEEIKCDAATIVGKLESLI